MTDDDAASLEIEFETLLEMTLQEVKAIEEEKGKGNRAAKFSESTAVFQPEYSADSVPTAISPDILRQISEGLTRVPDDFNVLPKIKRIV